MKIKQTSKQTSLMQTHSSWIELDQSSFNQNIQTLKKLISRDSKMAICLKSNAYGHGLEQLYKLVKAVKLDYIVIFHLWEAKVLREKFQNEEFEPKILLIGYWSTSDLDMILELDLEIYVSTFEQIHSLQKTLQEFCKQRSESKFFQDRQNNSKQENQLPVENKSLKQALDQKTEQETFKISFKTSFKKSPKRFLKIHIAIDTGMAREGFWPQDLDTVLTDLAEIKHLQITGLATHFATSDNMNSEYFLQQIKTFKQALDRSRSILPKSILIHANNSAATIRQTKLGNLVRVGLACYGLCPSLDIQNHLSKQQLELKPILSWKTKLLQIKTLKKGSYLGYDQSFLAEKDTLVGILPVGYGDGYFRNLGSGLGQVLIQGQFCSILGRVCMNIIMVDITKIANQAKVGDEVVLIGRQKTNQILATDLAHKAGTNSHEIFSKIQTFVPKFILDHG